MAHSASDFTAGGHTLPTFDDLSQKQRDALWDLPRTDSPVISKSGADLKASRGIMLELVKLGLVEEARTGGIAYRLTSAGLAIRESRK